MKWLVLIILLQGCQLMQPTQHNVVPAFSVWNGKIYAGDSKRLGVSRSPNTPVILCSDKDFDRMVCMDLEDYTDLIQYFLAAACVNQ